MMLCFEARRAEVEGGAGWEGLTKDQAALDSDPKLCCRSPGLSFSICKRGTGLGRLGRSLHSAVAETGCRGKSPTVFCFLGCPQTPVPSVLALEGLVT